MLQKGKDSMAKKLVIVESPHKSKTIEKYLGSEYKVVSSVGHIRDLSTSGKFGFGVDIDNNFKKILQEKEINFINSFNSLNKNYPENISLNAYITQNYLIHNLNFTDKEIIIHK